MKYTQHSPQAKAYLDKVLKSARIGLERMDKQEKEKSYSGCVLLDRFFTLFGRFIMRVM